MRLFHRTKSRSVLDLRQAKPAKPKKILNWLSISLITILGATALAGGSYYLLHKNQPSGKEGMQKAVQAVGSLMLLPENETPTYGTVTDIAKLKNQTFFAKARNGDEILIYEKAKLTILYRPSIQKIVNVGPLVVGSSGSPYVTSRFAVKNGTDNPSLNDKIISKIKQLYPNAVVVSSEKASRAYPTTITISLNKTNQSLNEQIADSLKIQAGMLPLGEPAPEADFLIIIGQDYAAK